MDAHLVIGTPTPQRLYRIVQMSSIWRSVADPTVGRETERTLASVRPS
ncbi:MULTISPECIES: hypothetical protein [Streptomyces]|uniref:Uncharacterized protein n=2 Tax=Streptomyces TaxID=1883 RepID=A0ABV9J708_9ACTN